MLKRRHKLVTEKTLRRNRRRFRLCYTILLLLIAGALYHVYAFVGSELRQYESARPKYVSEPYEKLFTERNFDALFAYEDESLFTCETKQDYIEYARKQTEGKTISVREAYNQDDTVKRYIAYAGDARFGEFSLKDTGTRTPRGYVLWAFDSLSTDFVHPAEYTVVVPKSSTLYANGKHVPDEEIVSETPAAASTHLPDTISVSPICTYRFTRALGSQDLSAIDEQGGLHTISRDSATGVYTALLNYDDALLTREMIERIEKVTTVFTRYFVHLTDRGTLYAYLLEGSAARENAKNFDNQWSIYASSAKLSDIDISQYTIYSDSYCSARVTCDLQYVLRGQTAHQDIDYVFYFQLVGENWMLYDFTTE